ncbi:Polyketide cyclase / dehydrase and lipid transport [Actinomadura rubteroloni]|uniref:Polyketide cyclase / dehydrase and lipid transport n=1 Tax=Actinomadura rubteroloni TaxID=1926885 RepID=A0A2P4UBL7_9ACTN|nr:SRPBCC family protein [Actinomadura rubteroloni]POM22443.1 Polyketide cyclase / dehydrase and lipid transport [Actinomadura rubteroloni]
MPRPYASAVLNATADEVWAYVRDFAGLAAWMPGVDTAVIEDGGPGDRIGCVRRLIGPGSVFRERLTALDDAARRYAYETLSCPLPVRDVRGRIRVAPVPGTGRALIEWSGTFTADPADERAMERTFSGGIYGGGLEALSRRFP